MIMKLKDIVHEISTRRYDYPYLRFNRDPNALKCRDIKRYFDRLEKQNRLLTSDKEDHI